MNAQLQPSPHAPDDTHSDVRWQAAIDTCADSIVQADEVGDLLATLIDEATLAAIRKAIVGHPLNMADRAALTGLHARGKVGQECVAAEYERRDEP